MLAFLRCMVRYAGHGHIESWNSSKLFTNLWAFNWSTLDHNWGLLKSIEQFAIDNLGFQLSTFPTFLSTPHRQKGPNKSPPFLRARLRCQQDGHRLTFAQLSHAKGALRKVTQGGVLVQNVATQFLIIGVYSKTYFFPKRKAWEVKRVQNYNELEARSHRGWSYVIWWLIHVNSNNYNYSFYVYDHVYKHCFFCDMW